MEIFIFAKMQIACLAILIYIGFVYIKEGNALNEALKIVDCNKLFDALFIVGEISLVFDGITAICVNFLDKVPPNLNLFFHWCFYISIQTFMFLFATYSIYITGREVKHKSIKILFVLPYLISVFYTTMLLPRTYYVIGKATNYSDGTSATITFLVVAVYAIFSIIELLNNSYALERRKKNVFVSWIIVSIVLFFLQVFFREVLMSGLGVTMIVIAAYEYIETPSLKQLTRTYNEMIMGFSTLVETKDGSTGGHIKRTSKYVDIIVKSLLSENLYKGVFTRDYLNCLEKAAPMHDIGKIAIPDNILKKPGKLTDEEYSVMKTHAEKGAEIIENTFGHLADKNYSYIAKNVAIYHHEKWDGTGYPKGLAGEEIPLPARIMAVADVFDAVSTNRCYREAMPLDECFKIIIEGSGKSFDPVMVKAFLKSRDEIEKSYFSMKE